MKVILLRDVAKIGRRHEIVDVPDGFALNKLIPKGDAKAATAGNVKTIAHQQQKNQQGKEGQLANLKEIALRLEKEILAIEAKANEQGHLFKAIHAEDVVTAAKKLGIELSKEYVVIPTPIKAVGEANITLQSQGKSFSLTINVIAK